MNYGQIAEDFLCFDNLEQHKIKLVELIKGAAAAYLQN
jgi:hypothetical protein